VTGDLAFTLAFFALIVLCIALTGLICWLYLLYKELFKKRGPDRPAVKTEACDLGLHDRCMKDWCICGCHVEPPVWVNHTTPRRRCHECRAIRRSQRRAAS